MVLQNLNDDRKLVLDTGQQDSEVVAIRADGETLYRVNDSIYSGKITGNQIAAATLLVKDVEVPQVHWASWGPATKTGKTAENSQN